MDRPIVLTGVVHGKTIALDEETCLPDGYRATLHLILKPGEGIEIAFGAWADMTPEQIADFEDTISSLRGRPIRMPENDET